MEGALALALPLNKGQSLSLVKNNKNIIHWKANKPEGGWFTADYELSALKLIYTDDKVRAKILRSILLSSKEMNNEFLSDSIGFDVTTNLGFNPEFGFGTSSTLISNIAKWANVDPYLLLTDTFGGSGYDIACASSKNPILFQIRNNEINITNVNFNPPEKDKLYFVYLGKKQSSSKEIKAFKKQAKYTSSDIDNISLITKELVISKDLLEFERLLNEHEVIMSRILKLPTAKSVYFSDFPGVVKSLGAWGGDFVLVTSNKPEGKLRSYMRNKGFDTVFSYSDLVL